MRTLVLDNGAYEIKVNWADSEDCMHVQNAMMRSRDRRLWLGNAVDLCKDLIGLQYRRPVERGQLYSWELEKPIWDWIWDTKKVVDDPDVFRESALLLTETPGSLAACSGNTDQIIFEEYEFSRYRRCAPQVLAANDTPMQSDAKLVIDLGFGATNITPVVHRTKVVDAGLRRLDIGGKVLTNYLKETVSYRFYNMMDETVILNKIKEQLCFVARDFNADLEKWHAEKEVSKYSHFAMSYALPSTHDDPYGHVITSLQQALEDQKSAKEQVLILENERFSTPEALFDPMGHLGMEEAGLPEVVADSIAHCPEAYQPLLWPNIVVCGGSSKFPGMIPRIETELQKWCPTDVPLRITTHENPAEMAWRGGSKLVIDEDFDFNGWTVAREEYLEQGPAYTAKKMATTNRL